MRWVLFCLTIFSLGFSNPLDNFTEELSPKQKSLLHEFISKIIDSPSGYVLFGDKPMHIERIDFPTLGSFSSLNPRAFTLLKGRELWSQLKFPKANKKYLLNTFDLGDEVFFISMNRDACLKVIEENLSLFQFILGPKVTPENLFWSLANSKEHFFEVLKNNQVLIELLQGNGKQNAIAHSRLSEIRNPSHLGVHEEFPLISKKLIRNWAIAPDKYKMEPSFGYRTLNQEELALNEMSSLRELRQYPVCQLPNFLCNPHTEETESLLSLYEKNRASLIQTLEEGDYFANTLAKFFTTNEGTFDFPKVPDEVHVSLPETREEILAQVVQIIQDTVQKEPIGAKKCVMAFLKGALARERDEDWPPESRSTRSRRTEAVKKDLLGSENLRRADAYFKELKDRLDLTALVPEKLYYKTLKSGKGNVSTPNLERVSFQFAYRVLGKEPSKDWGIIKDEHIGALIPGIAYALIGMQSGEERVVYIHPSYGYGETSFFPPNATIVAQIRLLEFTEGDQTAVIFSPHKLQKHDYKDLLVKYEVLRSEEYYYDGLVFWDNIKKSGQFFDFQNFYKTFLKESKELTSLDGKQATRFMSDLGYLLLSLQK